MTFFSARHYDMETCDDGYYCILMVIIYANPR